MKLQLEYWSIGYDELGIEIPATTPAQLFIALRDIRDILLRESDWSQNADFPFSDSEKQAWVEFRHTLRNLPSQYDETTITAIIEIDNPPLSAPKSWITLTPEYYAERQAQITAVEEAIIASNHANEDHTGADHTH